MPDRTVNVRLTATNSDYNRAVLASAAVTRQFSREGRLADASISDLGNTAGGSSREIDRFSGRLGFLLDIAASLGPALVPITAVAIPGVTGLASAFGFAAIGAGTFMVGIQGVGDAVKALNKARLEPTTANLEAADKAMRQLGPDSQRLARYLSDLTDEWHELRDASAEGVAPGVIEALDELLTRAPQVERILSKVGTAVGDMLADGAESLASDRWDDFFDFIEDEAPDAITSLAASIGSLTHAAAELWRGFQPLNGDALGWLEDATRRFDEWATHLSETEGFEEFVDYIRDNGPEVGEVLGSIGMALVSIAEAAAPVGAVTLPILEQLAKIVSALADSDLGTPLLAALAFSRGMALLGRTIQTGPALQVRNLTTDLKTMASTSVVAWGRSTEATLAYERAAARTKSTLAGFGKAAGMIGGLTLATSGLTDKVGLTNTVMGASLGLIAGPWGAAVGGAAGLVLDLADAHKRAQEEVKALADTLDQSTGAATQQTYVQVADALADWRDEAEGAGIAFEDLVAAAVQGGPALDDINAKLVEQGVTLDANASAYAAYYGYAQPPTILGKALQEQHDKLVEGKEAIDAKAAAERAGADAAEAAGAATDDAADAQERENDQIKQAISLMQSLRDERLRSRDAELNYYSALNDATKAAKDNGRVLKENGGLIDRHNDKAIESKKALLDVAGAWNDLSTGMQNKKGAYTAAIDNFADLAVKMGMSRDEAVDLAKKLLEIPTKRKTDIEVDTRQARQDLGEIISQLGKINSKHIRITVEHQDVRLEGQGAGGSGAGGPGSRTFTGRTIPGGGGLPPGNLPVGGHYGGYTKDPLAGGMGPLPGVDGKALRDAFRDLILSLADGREQIRDELAQLKRDLRQSGGVWTDAMRQHAERILALARKYDDQVRVLGIQQDALDRFKDSLDDLRSAAQSFADQVAGNFAHDLFGRGLSGFFLQAGADTNDATLFQQVLAQLVGMGLDGGAYSALAASGDLGTAQELLATGMIDAFEQAFNSRQSALGVLGGSAAAQAYGAQIAATETAIRNQTLLVGQTQATLAGLQAAVDRQERTLAKLAGLDDRVEQGAKAGTRQGIKEGMAGVGGRR